MSGLSIHQGARAESPASARREHPTGQDVSVRSEAAEPTAQAPVDRMLRPRTPVQPSRLSPTALARGVVALGTLAALPVGQAVRHLQQVAVPLPVLTPDQAAAFIPFNRNAGGDAVPAATPARGGSVPAATPAWGGYGFGTGSSSGFSDNSTVVLAVAIGAAASVLAAGAIVALARVMYRRRHPAPVGTQTGTGTGTGTSAVPAALHEADVDANHAGEIELGVPDSARAGRSVIVVHP